MHGDKADSWRCGSGDSNIAPSSGRQMYGQITGVIALGARCNSGRQEPDGTLKGDLTMRRRHLGLAVLSETLNGLAGAGADGTTAGTAATSRSAAQYWRWRVQRRHSGSSEAEAAKPVKIGMAMFQR
jgi:hypothetical protein